MTTSLSNKTTSTPKPTSTDAQTNHLRMALRLIRERKVRIDAQRTEAVENSRWSAVAGLDGMGTGLQLAANIVQEELEHLERRTADAVKKEMSSA